MTSTGPWELRRPFSRKIRVDAAGILSGRFAAGRKWNVDRPLEAALLFLGAAYRGDQAAADDILQGLSDFGRDGRLRPLMATTDLRKTILACFRAYLEAHDAIGRPLAARLLKFQRLIDPECERIFVPSQTGPTPPSLLNFEYAPTLPRKLDVALIFRPRYSGPHSRPHDLSVRLQDAFAAVGLDCRLVDPSDPGAEPAACDLAIVDDAGLFEKDAGKKRQYLERLRRRATSMAMIDLDAWQSHFIDRLAANRDLYDFVWLMAPSEAARIRGISVCQIPFPVGADAWFADIPPADGSPAQAGAKFCGGLEDYNFHRYFWLLAGAGFAVPFAFELTSHADDQQSVGDSAAAYLRKVAARRACLSFTMRSNGQRVMVGRAFDALRLGRVLVQEETPDMAAYFEPGVHFLDFRTVPELERLCAQLAASGAFEDIRRAGAAFFSERYSNEAVIRNLMTFF